MPDAEPTYGVPRVTAELHDTGVRVNHKRVARVMRAWGIVGFHLRKKVRTTLPEPSATPVPDLLRRQAAYRFAIDERRARRSGTDVWTTALKERAVR